MTKRKANAVAVEACPEPEIETAAVRAERVDRPLTIAERMTAFRTATSSLPRWYAEQVTTGMTDEELGDALGRVLGIWGGSCGPGAPDVSFQGSGLRIWASWEIRSHRGDKPLFSGAATIAMAREIYGIANPQNHQMRLF